MLSFQTFSTPETDEETEPIPSPKIEVAEDGDRYGRFHAEPLAKGYGMTLGNTIRRVLYSSLLAW